MIHTLPLQMPKILNMNDPDCNSLCECHAERSEASARVRRDLSSYLVKMTLWALVVISQIFRKKIGRNILSHSTLSDEYPKIIGHWYSFA
jgi:hypothetical protein